jgi:hypothetical protein
VKRGVIRPKAPVALVDLVVVDLIVVVVSSPARAGHDAMQTIAAAQITKPVRVAIGSEI